MLVSMRQASQQLGCDRAWLRGYCEGHGIRLIVAGNSLCLDQRDLPAVKSHLRKLRKLERSEK